MTKTVNMKSKLLLLLGAVIFSSCENRDKLLTEDVWILHDRTIFDKKTDSMYTIHFEMKDSIITIKFADFGGVGVKEMTNPAHLTEWQWAETEYDEILVSFDNELRRYSVNTLDQETFEWSELIWPPKQISFQDTYKKGSSTDWVKDSIDKLFVTYYDEKKHGRIRFK